MKCKIKFYAIFIYINKKTVLSLNKKKAQNNLYQYFYFTFSSRFAIILSRAESIASLYIDSTSGV